MSEVYPENEALYHYFAFGINCLSSVLKELIANKYFSHFLFPKHQTRYLICLHFDNSSTVNYLGANIWLFLCICKKIYIFSFSWGLSILTAHKSCWIDAGSCPERGMRTDMIYRSITVPRARAFCASVCMYTMRASERELPMRERPERDGIRRRGRVKTNKAKTKQWLWTGKGDCALVCL